MSDLSVFFAENVETDVTEEIVVSERFKGKDGKPVRWKIRAMTEDENKEIRKSSTKSVKVKGRGYIPEFDQEDYISKLMVQSVVFPDLKNADLQSSYGVLGAEALLEKMLLSGEYGLLAKKVQEINGFQEIEALAEEVKNE